MITKRVQFENNNSEILVGELRIPEEEGKFPAVIVCHSFRGNKDRELMINLWDVISRAGFVCLRFDFSGHGESQGKFRDFTLSQEIRDLKHAYDFLAKHEQVDEEKIGIIGHSVGAMTAMLFTAQHDKVASLVSVSSKSSTEQFLNSYFSDYQQKEWRRRGWIMFHDFGELGSAILDDVKKHDILDSAGKLKCPLLIIHGTDDTTTPFEDARELFNHAKDPKKLELIDGAGHHFRDDAHRDRLLDLMVDWFVGTLK